MNLLESIESKFRSLFPAHNVSVGFGQDWEDLGAIAVNEIYVKIDKIEEKYKTLSSTSVVEIEATAHVQGLSSDYSAYNNAIEVRRELSQEVYIECDEFQTLVLVSPSLECLKNDNKQVFQINFNLM